MASDCSTLRLEPNTTDLSRIARRTGCIALVAMLWWPAPARAQTLDDLRKLVDEQRALLDAQAARLDAQSRELADLRKRVDDVNTVALGARQAVAELKTPARTLSHGIPACRWSSANRAVVASAATYGPKRSASRTKA